jgi:hypothetical protein
MKYVHQRGLGRKWVLSTLFPELCITNLSINTKQLYSVFTDVLVIIEIMMILELPIHDNVVISILA